MLQAVPMPLKTNQRSASYSFNIAKGSNIFLTIRFHFLHFQNQIQKNSKFDMKCTMYMNNTGFYCYIFSDGQARCDVCESSLSNDLCEFYV